MTINVSEAIDSDTAEVITVIRKYQGRYEDGIWVDGREVRFKALASVQPASNKQLQFLPEGERDNDVMMFICNKPLRGTSDRDSHVADIICRKGIEYKVIAPADWNVFGHNIVMGARIK